MDHAEQVSRSPFGGVMRRRAALSGEVAGQSAGIFTPVVPAPAGAVVGVSPTPPDPLTLRRRLVTIDLGQPTPSTARRRTAAVRNLQAIPLRC